MKKSNKIKAIILAVIMIFTVFGGGSLTAFAEDGSSSVIAMGSDDGARDIAMGSDGSAPDIAMGDGIASVIAMGDGSGSVSLGESDDGNSSVIARSEATRQSSELDVSVYGDIGDSPGVGFGSLGGDSGNPGDGSGGSAGDPGNDEGDISALIGNAGETDGTGDSPDNGFASPGGDPGSPGDGSGDSPGGDPGDGSGGSGGDPGDGPGGDPGDPGDGSGGDPGDPGDGSVGDGHGSGGDPGDGSGDPGDSGDGVTGDDDQVDDSTDPTDSEDGDEGEGSVGEGEGVAGEEDPAAQGPEDISMAGENAPLMPMASTSTTINLSKKPSADTTGPGWIYTKASNRYDVTGDVTITGSNASTKTVVWVVDEYGMESWEPASIEITLDNAKLVYDTIGQASLTFMFKTDSPHPYPKNTYLTLLGANTVQGGSGMPGLHIIRTDIIIQGSGSLAAIGGSGAPGIGSLTSGGMWSWKVSINSGTINAKGGTGGAGIGSGFSSPCGTIIINGGSVFATGGANAPGIGRGFGGDESGTVNINGGMVTLTGGPGGKAISANTVSVSIPNYTYRTNTGEWDPGGKDTSFPGSAFNTSGVYGFVRIKSQSYTFSPPAKVSGVKAASAGYNSVKVSWASAGDAGHYEVCRATSKTGTYKSVKIVDGASVSYTDFGLTSGKTYYYKVRAVSFDDTPVNTGFSAAANAKPVPAKVAGLAAVAASYNKINVSWGGVDGASGYQVYRATSSGGTYKNVKTVTKGATVSFENKSLSTGKTYYYKIRAYRTVSGKKVYGPFSEKVKAKPPLGAVGSANAATASATSIKVSWNKVAGASGYQIYRATSGGGTFKKAKTVTKGATVSATNKSLGSNKEYYYKVRAYRTVSGKKVYGAFSAVVSAKTTAAPKIKGPASMKLSDGYKATSSGVFTITGAPAPVVTKFSGDARITWNNAKKKLDIAAGIPIGTYPVTLQASNTIAPIATFTFTLTVQPSKDAPKITGPATMKLTAGYAATSSGAFTISGKPAPVVTKTVGDSRITWNSAKKKLDIAAGIPAGTYTVTLKAANGLVPDASFTFTLTVQPPNSAPQITGPSSMTLATGYKATSSGVFTIAGVPAPTVTKTSGDAKITWNKSTKKLDIAAGLGAGTYTVLLQATNGVSPNASFTFTLTVQAAVAPKITSPANMSLTAGYTATSSGVFTVTGTPAPTVSKSSGNAKITWNNSTKKLDIAAGLAAGTYTVTLQASNGVSPNSTCTFTLTVQAVVPVQNPGLSYNSAVYSAANAATLKLNITSVPDATSYTITEHSSLSGAQNNTGALSGRSWSVTQANAASPVSLTNTTTGLRFFRISVVGGVSAGRSAAVSVPVLYHPRNVGGYNAPNDGFLVATPIIMPIYDATSGTNVFVTIGMQDPYWLNITWEKVGGASGYDVVAYRNGTPYGDDLGIPQPGGNRVVSASDAMYSGTIKILIKPYVLDGSTKRYGETRTVVFYINTSYFPTNGTVKYYDNTGSVNDPFLEFYLDR